MALQTIQMSLSFRFKEMCNFHVILFCAFFVGSLKGAIHPQNDKCFDTVAYSVIFHYFKDQHFMTIADVSKYLSTFDAVACSGTFFRPIDIFSEISKIDFGPRNERSSVSSYPTTHGYYVRCKTKDVENGFFEKLSKANPRTRLMLNLVDGGFKTGKEILKLAYDKYKLLNVAMLFILPRFSKGTIITIDVNLCLYNPFAGDAHERSPEVRCWKFRKENLREDLVEMLKFDRQRKENLQGFPLKVSIFEYEMQCVAVYTVDGNISHFTYPDGELLSAVAKTMNFKPVYKLISDEPKYGFQKPGGEFVGNLGDLERGDVDLVANPIFISNFNTTKSVFLHPIVMAKLNFIVKKRFASKKILYKVYTQLDISSAIIATVIFFLLPPIYIFIHEMERLVLRRMERRDILKSFFYVIALQSSISMKHSTMRATRVAVAIILFYTLIGAAILQGTLYQELNSDRNTGRIKKIDQLIKQNFTIAIEPGLKPFFQEESDDEISSAIMKMTRSSRQKSYERDEAIEILKEHNKIAFLWGSELTGNYLNNFYDNQTGDNYMEVVPESAFEFYVSMIAPNFSPFIERFNQIISVYVETGLYQYNMKKASDDNQKIWIHRLKNGLTPKVGKKSLKFGEIDDAFFAYIAMIILCCLTFVIELLTHFLATNWEFKIIKKIKPTRV